MKFRLIVFIIISALASYGQNNFPFGKVKVKTLSQKDYNGNAQNWDIIQNNDNFLYVANNGGILEFNGEFWTRFEMMNTEHPRSFAKNEDGRIYVGGRGEFGYIDYNEFGKTIYVKISQQVDSLDFSDIWDIYCLGEHTYFISRNYVFVYFENNIDIIVVPENEKIKTSVNIDELIICTFESNEGDNSAVLRGNKFLPINNSLGISPVKLFKENDKNYLIDNLGFFHEFQQNGNKYQFVKLNNRSLNIGIDYRINDINIYHNLIVVGTAGNGVRIFDMQGNLIRSFVEKDGLENLEIRKIYFDQYANIWICNDNGITFIEISDAISSFDKDLGVTGITEDILLKNGDIFLATHTDIYTNAFENGQIVFQRNDIFRMEIFQIKEFQFTDKSKYTLVIANDGVYYLDDKRVKHLIDEIYAWDLYQSTVNPNRIFVGLDGDGVGSILYNNGKFTYEGNYESTYGEVRSVVEFNGKVYYSVKYDGVHVLDTNKEQSLNTIKGLTIFADSTSDYEQFTLTVFQNKMYVGTSNGLYEYEQDKLVPSKINEGLFNEEKLLVHRIINDNDEKLWLVLFHNSDTKNEFSEIGYVENNDGNYVWVSSPFRQLTDDIIHTVKRGKNGIYWFGGSSKVYAYNSKQLFNFDLEFNTYITQTTLNEDSIFLYNAHRSTITDHQIKYDYNSIRFDFATPTFLGGLENQYCYYLEGYENDWGKWKTTNYAEYQRLNEGEYTFHVKALNYYGYESKEATITFTVLPPWYRTIWAYLVYLILFILLIYVIIRLAIRRVQQQKEELEKIVQERTHEIAQQNQLLEHQKTEIEEKTNDILDSIKYAKRIQNTILPGEDKLKQIFEHDYFVLYKPKDIVSGDFYWAARFENKSVFSAIDCTGHGVPGAFVSIVGFNGLNRTVNEFKLRQPAAILDKLTELVVDTFSQSDSHIKDGMDIGLCAIDNETLKLEFSGANNPCVIVRNKEAIELKPDKQPIGEFEERKPFTNHDFQLEKGDCVYVFSDGYADQFGGPKGKKLKYKALKDLLINISNKDMKAQLAELEAAFEEWKGDYEQLDDVCLFGVKIK